jgi:hypothetical protein
MRRRTGRVNAYVTQVRIPFQKLDEVAAVAAAEIDDPKLTLRAADRVVEQL